MIVILFFAQGLAAIGDLVFVTLFMNDLYEGCSELLGRSTSRSDHSPEHQYGLLAPLDQEERDRV